MELYKKHRPYTLDDVVGQDTVVKQIKKSLETDNLPHAVLLTGPSGVGKTTIARIISSDLDVPAMNIEECNSSSDRGIDAIRSLIMKIAIPPLAGNKRFVIIDEAHGLTAPAQEALLKVLEECPDHTYIALLTTDESKLKRALKTRCSHFKLKAVDSMKIAAKLEEVSRFEQQPAGWDVCNHIAQASGGSMREALVLLQQCMVTDYADIEQTIIQHRDAETIDLLRGIVAGDWPKTVRLLKELDGWKSDPEGFRRTLLSYCSKVMAGKNPGSAPSVFEIFVDQTNLYSRETIPGLLYFALKG